MESTVHALALKIPKPQPVPYKDSFVFRYVEKTIYQALVQKIARLASTLRATQLLMQHGFVQEQASMQRIMDELQEDIAFLSYAIIFSDHTQLHQEYLDAFYEEEFDADSALASTQKRPMIPRRKIRAYIAQKESTALDPHTRAEAARTLSKAYSGYVHAASPQIMDMYGGNPPRFHMSGMFGTERHAEHRDDLWNYFYRGIMVFSFVAKAFGDEDLFTKIHEFIIEFERLSGKDNSPSSFKPSLG